MSGSGHHMLACPDASPTEPTSSKKKPSTSSRKSTNRPELKATSNFTSLSRAVHFMAKQETQEHVNENQSSSTRRSTKTAVERRAPHNATVVRPADNTEYRKQPCHQTTDRRPVPPRTTKNGQTRLGTSLAHNARCAGSARRKKPSTNTCPLRWMGGSTGERSGRGRSRSCLREAARPRPRSQTSPVSKRCRAEDGQYDQLPHRQHHQPAKATSAKSIPSTVQSAQVESKYAPSHCAPKSVRPGRSNHPLLSRRHATSPPKLMKSLRWRFYCA